MSILDLPKKLRCCMIFVNRITEQRPGAPRRPLSSWLIREEFARVWRVFIDTRARGTIHYKGSLSKAPCVLVVWTLFPKANVSVFELSRT